MKKEQLAAEGAESLATQRLLQNTKRDGQNSRSADQRLFPRPIPNLFYTDFTGGWEGNNRKNIKCLQIQLQKCANCEMEIFCEKDEFLTFE